MSESTASIQLRPMSSNGKRNSVEKNMNTLKPGQYSSDEELFSEAEIDTIVRQDAKNAAHNARSIDSKSVNQSSFHLFDKRRQSRFFILSMFFLLVVSMGFVMTFLLDDNLLHQFRHTKREHSTLSFDNKPLVNCTPLAVNQFPKDKFSQSERRSGAVILHCILVAYMFLALAIVCDDFFVPSLEAISAKLKLNPDVAGATFMAIGSSTPELFTSIIGVFITEDDIGVGTIVGSAVFNIVFIISLCALLTDAPITLSWYPLIRDSLFYSLSIFALVCIMLDHTVYWYEALMMLVLYALYIVLMYINDGAFMVLDSFMRSCCPNFCCPLESKYNDIPQNESCKTAAILSFKGDLSPSTEVSSVPLNLDSVASSDEEDEVITSVKTKLLATQSPSLHDTGKTASPNNDVQGPEDTKIQEPNGKKAGTVSSSESIKMEKECDYEDGSDNESPLKYPSDASFWSKCLWIISFPIYLLLTFTVPDCRNFDNKLLIVFASFFLSILWIAFFSYLLVWMVTIIGYTLSIPDTIMGLTLLAAGTSVPDAMASVIVARNGEGDMAVSNSIGSNIFDILLCLGLPWFLKAVKQPVPINSAGLTYISFTLTTTVILIVGVIMLNRWVLNRKLGVFLLFLYLIFIVYASLVETNTFGYVNPPPCTS